jgi:hypothetical protein
VEADGRRFYPTLIELGSLRWVSTRNREIAFKDVRFYPNTSSDKADLIRGVFYQVKAQCMPHCVQCESPEACSVCKEGYSLKAGQCNPAQRFNSLGFTREPGPQLADGTCGPPKAIAA